MEHKRRGGRATRTSSGRPRGLIQYHYWQDAQHAMHPEIRQRGSGNCPKCGMALEPWWHRAPRTEWTCPMHPQIVRDEPGSCPICGMALEPRTVGAVEGPDPELVDMTRRFWIGLVLTLPLLAFVMGDMLPGQPLRI